MLQHLICLRIEQKKAKLVGCKFKVIQYIWDSFVKRQILYKDNLKVTANNRYLTVIINIFLIFFVGVLSVAVPGEVLAMHNAWKTQGRLPWKRLFQPTIDLANNGFKIDEPLAKVIEGTKNLIKKERGFRYTCFIVC